MNQKRDWKHIEWITLRAEFISALYLPKHSDEARRPNLLCTCENCSEVPRLAVRCGLSFFEDPHRVLDYEPFFYDLVTSEMRDAQSMIRTAYMFDMFQSHDILEGYQEIPQIVGEILSSEHFVTLAQDRVDYYAPRRFTRELVTALVEVALPDHFLKVVAATELG